MDLEAINEPSQPPGSDYKAEKEQKAYFAEHTRKQRVKTTLNYIFIAFIILTSLVAMVVICIRLIHLVLPPHLQWLTNDQIQGIDKIFFSGAIGGFLVNYFKKANGE
jgi:hypothetical protein